ncbi:DUF5009 domain-containing protein [Microcoleus sp. FACHB-831]|uniref:DUF5009 domain-containing protein n=1 Tax=Microcoleus sp. FACHB-831 TaxID=2692827 RepID=UPI001683B11B|nr:DUF5009 domain-containing protein [Microcoleus sp. FACHB-831]MBD1920471.1 DUF5009 domain-containing protein [Microcoleus sp. FACHB-831]
MSNIVLSSTVATQKRAYALDALRGFAVLAMVLSGTIKFGILPAWMYHAQNPPPNHTYNPNLPGLTWVDIVFPLFLFSMGAAIPLALSRRLEKGFSKIQILLSILKRGFFLGAFAIFIQHFRPHVISAEANNQKWWLALLGFVLLFLMFVRLPNFWLPWKRRIITISAWLTAIIVLSTIQYPNGNGFSFSRSDIILIVLTNMAVFGSLLWLLTKSNLLLRLGCMGLLLALRLSASTDGWIAQIWKSSPSLGFFKLNWIFQFGYLSYLLLIIPGTIAGDLILSWLQSSIVAVKVEAGLEETSIIKAPIQWTIQRYYCIIALMFSICIILLMGLQGRWVWQTTLISAVICSAGWFLFAKPVTETDKLLSKFYRWGVYWLALGLLFEPYEKGIKKDPATLSYYFVCSGIALFLLIVFTIAIEILKKQKWLQLLIDNGQNPMIAYVGFANLIWPILALTQLETRIIESTTTPFTGFLKGVAYTLVVACVVSVCTRLKLFWRT